MSTAVAISEPTRRMGQYTIQDRREAAQLGWQRRKGLVEQPVYVRFYQAIRDADPTALRLYVCDVAEAAQRHYLAVFPEDRRTLDGIAVAPRYASGEASEQERLKALRILHHLCDATYNRDDPAAYAAQAASFALSGRLHWVAEWGLLWADCAEHQDHRNEASMARHLQALEALRQQ
jgi:hypothetical protein